MKIELTDSHFGMEVQCPNCKAYISVPDINKLQEQKALIAKELEELRKTSKQVSTNTALIDRSSLTIKVPYKGSTEDKDAALSTPPKNNSDEDNLRGRLKGLQAANLILNEELNSLKFQKEEFLKSLELVKKLQHELSLKESEIDALKKKGKNKTIVSFSKAKNSTLSIPVNALLETQEQLKPYNDDQDKTLNVKKQNIDYADCRCINCYREFPVNAKFCLFCGEKNEDYQELN